MEVKGYRTALFIDTDARRLAPSQQGQSWRTNLTRPTFWAKTVLLWANIVMVGVLVDYQTGRGLLVVLSTALFVLRVQLQMALFWRRAIPWKEVVLESGGIIPLSFLSLGAWCTTDPLSSVDWTYFALFVLGSAINFVPEWQRYRWKTDDHWKSDDHYRWKSRPIREAQARIGRLYTGSLFRYARHVNYTGEFVSFVGLALLTGCWWTLWVPGCMGAGLATFSLWEIEFYLAQRYSKEWPTYCKQCPWLLIPGIY